MKRALKLVVILLMLAAVCLIKPIRLPILVWLGRAGPCTVQEAARSSGIGAIQAQLKDSILKASKRLQQDPAGFNQWDTPMGRYWVPRGSDWGLFWDLAEQSRKIYGTGERSVRAGDVVLDCGANVGVYTRVALAAGAGTIVAIELAPENLECLRRNFAPEIQAGRVIVYPKGVWDKDDVLTLTVAPDNSAADSLVMHPKGSHAGPQVPLTTIDKLVAELKLPRVDFIKMDIEGAERNALMGAQHTLAQFHPRMALSAYHLPDDPQKIPALVRQAWSGYRMECGSCVVNWTAVRPEVLFFF
jgi:FkbM family methyltransferase